MAQPTQGEVRNFYCKCIEKTRSEFERDRLGLLKEHNISVPTPSATSWICKCRKYKSWKQSTGLFSSIYITAFEYYWECMNCGKKTIIGVWGNNGVSYGDGRHL